jgi:hypothetical protein
MELLVGTATAPSTTFTGLTMAAGNSLTIRSTPIDAKIYLLQVWADNQGAGAFRIRSPRLHDNVQGIRLDVIASTVHPLLPCGFKQPLISQDSLVAELTGSATAGDIETAAMLLYYENIPAIDARLASAEQIMPLVKHILTVENTLALGTAGGYSGEESLNAEFDLLKANTDYAILGYHVDAECAAIRYRGIDSGNLGYGGPGADDLRFVTEEWFVRLSRLSGLPCIPVFNSANVDGILVDGAQDENGTDVTVTTILAELGPSPVAVGAR